MAEIIVDRLTKDYGFKRGVFDVSFTVEQGEAYGFLGPNGAGKSTTIRHLMGFSKPDQGRTLIFGLETFTHYSKLLDRVGYLPGEIALPDGLTGYEFIDMMKKLRNVKDERRIKDLLTLFQLDPIEETKRMSFGDKRKLTIVTALMHDPDVLIMDEPTSGLDPVMQDTFIQLIKEEKKRGKTILLSSHIFSEVEAVCDRVSIIKNGYIIEEFSMSQLKYAEDKIYRVHFSEERDAHDVRLLIEKQQFAKVIEQDNCWLTIAINDKDINRLVHILSQYRVINFAHERVTLEDYFMQYYIGEDQFKGVVL